MSSYKLICGDSAQVLKTFDDKQFDICVTDPPYPNLRGGYEYNFPGVAPTRNSISVGEPWSTSLEWIKEAKRISKYGMMIFCAYNSVADIANECSDLRKVALITWYKRNSPPTGKNVPRFTTEFIWCFSMQPGLQWDAITTTMLDIPKPQGGCMAVERLQNQDGTSVHPTQKPVWLMSELLKVVRKGQSIIDPFAGTGTTGVSAIRAGLDITLIEKDPVYFSACERRIHDAAQQPLLFA